jgi:anti-anti-sigma factor
MMENKMITTEERNGVAVARVHENKLYHQAVQAFRSELLGLIDRGPRLIVVDLSEVAVMNSSALGVIILTYDRLQKEGGALALCGLCPILEELFLRMHLNELFPVVRTADEGVSILTGPKNIPAK